MTDTDISIGVSSARGHNIIIYNTLSCMCTTGDTVRNVEQKMMYDEVDYAHFHHTCSSEGQAKSTEQNSSTPRLPLSSPTRVLVWRNRAWLPRADESGYVHGAMIEPWHVTSSTRISILALNPNLFTGFRVTPVLHHQPLSIIYCLNMLTYFSKCSEYHIRPCIFTMVVQQILIAYRMCHLKSRPYNT